MIRLQQQVFDFTFPVSRHDRKRPLRSFQRRDGVAVQLLVSALGRHGFVYGEPIFNQPPIVAPKEKFPVERFPIDTSFVRPRDLILQVTRPPIHDDIDGNMKRVERGYTSLEQELFELFTPVFLAHCSRERVVLGGAQRAFLTERFRTCGEMQFQQRGDLGPLQSTQGVSASSPLRTAVFLLHLPEIRPGGPRYLCAFGMTGMTTMVWAYHLAMNPDFDALLARPGFHVYSLEIDAVPERQENLRWSGACRLEPMLSNDFGDATTLQQVLDRCG